LTYLPGPSTSPRHGRERQKSETSAFTSQKYHQKAPSVSCGSRACVPEPDGIVVRSGCQQLTVRREGHGVDPESCPSRVCSGAPEPASQSLTVSSPGADASSSQPAQTLCHLDGFGIDARSTYSCSQPFHTRFGVFPTSRTCPRSLPIYSRLTLVHPNSIIAIRAA